MSNVTDIDDHRPHVVIDTGEHVHVISVGYLNQIADKKLEISDLYDWKNIVPLIIGEWLELTEKCCDE